MRNSIWKLSILVGVVCTGFLCVLQAQRGISRPGLDPANFKTQEQQSARADAPISDANVQPAGFAEEAPTEGGVQTAAAESSAPPVNPFSRETKRVKNPPADNTLAQAEPFSFSDDRDVTPASGLRSRSKEKKSQQFFFDEEPRASEPTPEPASEEPASSDPSESPFGELAEPAQPESEDPVAAEPEPAAAPDSFEDDPFSSFPSAEPTAEPAAEPPTATEEPATIPLEPEPSAFEAMPPAEEPADPGLTPPAESLDFPTSDEPASAGQTTVPPPNTTEEPFPALPPATEEPATPPTVEPQPLPEPQAASPATPFPEPNAIEPSPEASQLPTEPTAPSATPTEPAAPAALPVEPTTPATPPVAAGQRPQLTIEKQAPENAVLGQPMIYSIVVKNVGQSAANQVVVEDVVPKDARLTGTIPRAEMRGDRLFWKLGTLAANEEKKIAVRVVPLAEGEIGSIATVNFVSEVATEMNVTAPRLTLEMQSPESVQLGQPVEVGFKVSNTGTGAAKGVLLRDIIPDGLQHAAGSDLEYEIGAIGPGESREVKLTLGTTKLGRAMNHAIILAEGGLSLEEKKPIDIVGTPLVISRTGPKTRYLGSPALYTNMITNKSDTTVAATTIMEIVPAGMEFTEATEGGQYDPAKRVITWHVEQIGPHESKVLKVKLTPRSEGSLTSVVRVVDPNGHKAEAASETRIVGFVSLGIEIPAVEAPIEVGEEMHLRIAARNRGTSPASNVRMKVVVPEHLTVTDVKAPSKYTQNGNVIEFDPVPTIDGQTRAEVDITVKAATPGDARLAVEISADQMEQPLSGEEAIYILPPAGTN